MDGRRLGSLVGAVGGLLFVLLSAGDVPASWVWRGLGVAMFVAVLGCAAYLHVEPPPRPTRRGVRLYGWSVVAMVVAIFAGARVLDTTGNADLVRAWVVLVVGVHFVPLTLAFRQRLYARIGGALFGLGLVGLVGRSEYAEAPAASAVGAGLVLLLGALLGLVAGRVTPA